MYLNRFGAAWTGCFCSTAQFSDLWNFARDAADSDAQIDKWVSNNAAGNEEG